MMTESTIDIEEYAAGFLGAALLDESLCLVEISAGVQSISGHPQGSLTGVAAFEVLHPDDHERAAEALLELARTQLPTVDGIYRMRFLDGTFHDYALRAHPIVDGDRVMTVMQFSEVSDVLRAEEFVRDAVEVMRMLGEAHELDECLERIHRVTERHVPGIRLVITTFGANDGAKSRSHERLPEGTYRSSTGPEQVPPHVEQALANHLNGPWRAFNRMAEFETTDAGSRITSVLTDDQDELLGFVEGFRDSDAEPDNREWMVHGLVRQVLSALLRRVRLDEQLKAAADQDPLTGLANRRRLFSDMAACDDITGSTLLLIDLDRFSWINNNLGHQVGDETLVALAERLGELCPPQATITRFGGDEFVVWSPSPLSVAELEQALRSSRIVPDGSGDRRGSVRCSIGAITIRRGESATEAIQRADEAMYEAKSKGGDGAHVVTEDPPS